MDLDEIERRDLCRVFGRLLGELKPKEGASVYLREVYGETFKDIAKAIGVDRTRVHSIYLSGLRRLRHPERLEVLRDYGEHLYEATPYRYRDIAPKKKSRPLKPVYNIDTVEEALLEAARQCGFSPRELPGFLARFYGDNVQFEMRCKSSSWVKIGDHIFSVYRPKAFIGRLVKMIKDAKPSGKERG